MRVLHVIPGLGPGGAETVLYRLIRSTSGIDHEVVCLSPPDWYSSKLREMGITVHHVDWTSAGTTLSALREVTRLIKRANADLVQAWMYRGNLFGGIAARIAGVPVVWNIRCSSLDPLPMASRLIARLGGILARWIPRTVVNCSAQSAVLHENWGYGAAEGAVIPNGYDSSEFFPDEAARVRTRKSLGLPETMFVVGSVGRWHPQKGFPVLLEAARLLQERGVALRLLLVGRGLDPANGELAGLVTETGCDDVVQLLGERTDIREIDRALDLHVLASIGSEGFPNVVAETMASGTPNVVTDIGDSALIAGGTGWVVAPGDVRALADAIGQAQREWKSSPAEWKRRREAARESIVSRFSVEKMAQSYMAVWQTAAGQAAGRQRAAESSAPAVDPAPAEPLRRSR